MSDKEVWILIGATACGKSGASPFLAERMNAEIVSMDSMKIYRGMDIGTAKPSSELRRKIPFHLLDIRDPWEEFNVGDYWNDAEKLIDEISARGRKPLFEGGTALYFKAITEGLFSGPPADWNFRQRLQERAEQEGLPSLYEELKQKDPPAAAKILPGDLRRIIRALEVFELTGSPISDLQEQFGKPRPGYRFHVAFVNRERTELYERIDRRIEKMFSLGLVEECRRLFEHPRGLSRAARQAIGYKEIFDHFEGKHPLEEAHRLIKRNTRDFARHQLIWFRKFKNAVQIDVTGIDSKEIIAEKLWQSFNKLV